MDSILVEPADSNRQAFARWCLAQDPKIPTASARGSLVPADLFPSVPDYLLDRAHIDGHMFRPVVEGKAPEGDGYREAVKEEVKTPARRKRS